MKAITMTNPVMDGNQFMIFCFTFYGLTTGGGVVSGHEPAMKPEGEPLRSGYISLQSEGHPIQFRNIRLQVVR